MAKQACWRDMRVYRTHEGFARAAAETLMYEEDAPQIEDDYVPWFGFMGVLALPGRPWLLLEVMPLEDNVVTVGRLDTMLDIEEEGTAEEVVAAARADGHEVDEVPEGCQAVCMPDDNGDEFDDEEDDVVRWSLVQDELVGYQRAASYARYGDLARIAELVATRVWGPRPGVGHALSEN